MAKVLYSRPLRFRSFIFYTLSAIAFAFLGAMFTLAYTYDKTKEGEACFQSYNLTSKTLDCEEYEESSARVRALDIALGEKVSLYVAEDKAERVSVWVRDLNTRQWAASNELERYAPASLFKTPLMIAYFKMAEIQPSILDAQIPYQSSTPEEDPQNFDPAEKLVPGQSYKVADLIERMIIYSDNEAARLLLEHILPNVYENVLLDLGIVIPSGDGTTDFVTVKTYANIYRILYNASYLSREYSQRALSILSKSSFKGIAESLPGVTVAHKFGERRIQDQNGNTQKVELHDCGIVYKESRVYNLCIMTDGKNFDDLLSIIKDLSLTAYNSL